MNMAHLGNANAIAKSVKVITDKYDLPEEEVFVLFGETYQKYLNEELEKIKNK